MNAIAETRIKKSAAVILAALLLLATSGPDISRAYADPIDVRIEGGGVSPGWTPVMTSYFENLQLSRFDGRTIGNIHIGTLLSHIGGLQFDSSEGRRVAGPLLSYLESRVGTPQAFRKLDSARQEELIVSGIASVAEPLRSEAATLSEKVEAGNVSSDETQYVQARLKQLATTGIYYMEPDQQHRVIGARDTLAKALRQASADSARRSAANAALQWGGKASGGSENGVIAPEYGFTEPKVEISQTAAAAERRTEVPAPGILYREGEALPISQENKMLEQGKAYRAQWVGQAVGASTRKAWDFVRGKGWMIAAVGAGLLMGENADAASMGLTMTARPIAGAAIGGVAGFAAGFAIVKAKVKGGGDYDLSPLAWIGGGLAGAFVGALIGSVAASGLSGAGSAAHGASKTLIADAIGGIAGFAAGFSVAKVKMPGGGDYDFSPLFWFGAGLLGAVAGVLIAAAAVSLL